MAVNVHNPTHPEWDCDTCGRPWPCDPARLALRERYDAGTVGRMMHQLMPYAARETQMPARELYERFVQWTVPR